MAEEDARRCALQRRFVVPPCDTRALSWHKSSLNRFLILRMTEIFVAVVREVASTSR